ncbi:unnamed protein product [Chironomus riparius]|uniref:C2H2-type domain-containing protein n=1 Tax=Chironomus riparius TaxID=315576 RepID=A0A9N9S1P4_9DIPT|nr:unnamed protein product [Chironomus riparius]
MKEVKMAAKITDFFKIEPKSLKVDEEIKILPPIRKCQVVLQDINHKIGSNELKLFEKISFKGKHICKYCGEEFTQQWNLIKHMKMIHPSELTLFNCPICNQRFDKKSFMEVHMKKEHSNGQIIEKKFECDIDGKIFSSKVNIKVHMICHLPMVACSMCPKILKPHSMRIHLNRFHTPDKKYFCEICPKHYGTKQLLKIHKKTHKKRFECTICNKMFSHKNHFKYHKKCVHENPRNFECEICGLKFNEKRFLLKHQVIHNKNRIKLFKCQRCECAFDNNYNLKKHQKAHERQDKKVALMENPLKCNLCQKFYKNEKSLTIHLLRVHPKNLYQCDLCALFIKAKSLLLKHLNIHLRSYLSVKKP